MIKNWEKILNLSVKLIYWKNMQLKMNIKKKKKGVGAQTRAK